MAILKKPCGIFLLGLAFFIPAFTFAVPARRAMDLVDAISVNTHLGYTNTIYGNFANIIKPRLSELGILHIREGYYGSGQAAKLRELNRDLGIKATVIFRASTAVADVRQLTTAPLDAGEGVNEWDNFGVTPDWAARTRTEQIALSQAWEGDTLTRNIPLLGPSFANVIQSPLDVGDLSAYMDYGNIHPYQAAQAPSRHWGWGRTPMQVIATARAVSGSKPIQISESGYHQKLDNPNHPGCSETASAKYFTRLHLIAWGIYGIARTATYEFADQFPDPGFTDQEHHFGILRNDGSIKPAFHSLRNFIFILKDMGGTVFAPGNLNYSLSGDTAGVYQLLLQKQNGDFFLVLWQEAVSYDITNRVDLSPVSKSVTLTLNQPILSAQSFLPLSSTNPANHPANPIQLVLSVPDHPLILRLVPSVSLTLRPKPMSVRPFYRIRVGQLLMKVNDSHIFDLAGRLIR